MNKLFVKLKKMMTPAKNTPTTSSNTDSTPSNQEEHTRDIHAQRLGFCSYEELNNFQNDIIGNEDLLEQPVNVDLGDINNRLSFLGESAVSEFYRLKKYADYFTHADILRLEAMEKSHAFSQRHGNKIKEIDWSQLETTNLNPKEFYILQPEEILFLWYIYNHKISTENMNIPGYWTHEYNLNYQEIFEKFFKMGYLRWGDLKDSINTYTIKQIKHYTALKGLSSSGKKIDLINRILDHSPENEIVDFFKNKTFQSTPQGVQIVLDNEHIVYFHQRKNYFNIPIKYVYKKHCQSPQLSKYELAIHIMDIEAEKHLNNKCYGLYRNTLYCKSIIYKDAEDLLSQLCFLFKVCYIDRCGFSNLGIEDNTINRLNKNLINEIKLNPYINSNTQIDIWEIYTKSINELPIKSKHLSLNDVFDSIMFEEQGGDFNAGI